MNLCGDCFGGNLFGGEIIMKMLMNFRLGGNK